MDLRELDTRSKFDACVATLLSWIIYQRMTKYGMSQP